METEDGDEYFVAFDYVVDNQDMLSNVKWGKYIKPVMEITEVEVGVILAGSGTTPSPTLSDETIDKEIEVLARPSNGSLWD